jgi:aconitate hydratase
MPHNLFETFQEFDTGSGSRGNFHSLPQLEAAGIAKVSRLPVSLRIVLESVLRNFDGHRITEDHVRTLAGWQPTAKRTEEIPFMVARVLLQDFTGVPLLVDLAAMRSAVARLGRDPQMIEPLVPVDLVIDHSVQVDHAGSPDALNLNMTIEFKRNRERYQFLKWGMQAFSGFRVVPPGIGIVHQVNLEYLARGVFEKNGVYYPDTLVGTDSHTTMINGLGIVAWGVGGIEAEAGMLDQPVYFLTPDVVGVHMTGTLREGVTATDLALHVTEMLRKAKVVGKFVEYFGEGAATLSLADRATVANMSPEYGATMGYFPVDEESCRYLSMTGRPAAQVDLFRNYFKAQGLFGMPKKGEIDYSLVLDLQLDDVQPSVAGPKRPQDRINLFELRDSFSSLLTRSVADGGYGRETAKPRELRKAIGLPAGAVAEPLRGGGEQDDATIPVDNRNTSMETETEMMTNRPTPNPISEVGHAEYPEMIASIADGDVLIAAITSCTNTSNPSVMIGAGILAKKAVEKGLRPSPIVKSSLAPGSRVVTEYLMQSGLQPYLDQLNFHLVGYGCTTCIGNSGPLDPAIEEAVTQNDIVGASVLSGNRNFEARVHQNIRANFLMSPPLVVAFALAGRVDIDMSREPIGRGNGGEVYLRDIWPTSREIAEVMATALGAETFRRMYSEFAEQNPLWDEIPSTEGALYEWSESTYIQEPPFFDGFSMDLPPLPPLSGARALAVFADSITTDHISPAGSIKAKSPAGRYLIEQGVEQDEFNSYGSRRGNDRVMTRGTFANVRIKNQMVPGVEGGVTVHQPSGEQMSIYDAAVRYQADGVPLFIFAGQEYGTGSSRDWAAKGTQLLGVKVVVAQSFERIHRSNLVGMGVLPCQFEEGTAPAALGLDGSETFSLTGVESLAPQQMATLRIESNGSVRDVPVRVRIDTPIELEYYRHGGILPYVLRQILHGNA